MKRGLVRAAMARARAMRSLINYSPTVALIGEQIEFVKESPARGVRGSSGPFGGTCDERGNSRHVRGLTPQKSESMCKRASAKPGLFCSTYSQLPVTTPRRTLRRADVVAQRPSASFHLIPAPQLLTNLSDHAVRLMKWHGRHCLG